MLSRTGPNRKSDVQDFILIIAYDRSVGRMRIGVVFAIYKDSLSVCTFSVHVRSICVCVGLCECANVYETNCN